MNEGKGLYIAAPDCEAGGKSPPVAVAIQPQRESIVFGMSWRLYADGGNPAMILIYARYRRKKVEDYSLALIS